MIPHMIRVTREDGRPGLLHPAAIFGFYQNSVPTKGGTIDVLSITLSNNVTWHIRDETEASFLSKLAQANHCRVNVIEEARKEDMLALAEPELAVA